MMDRLIHILGNTTYVDHYVVAIMELEKKDTATLVDMDLLNVEVEILRDGAVQRANLVAILNRNVIV